MITEQQVESVIVSARKAAWDASTHANKQLGIHAPEPGVVWLLVDVKRSSSLGKILTKFGLIKHADKHGLVWFNPSGHGGNNYKIHLAGAECAAEILRNVLGVKVTVSSMPTL